MQTPNRTPHVFSFFISLLLTAPLAGQSTSASAPVPASPPSQTVLLSPPPSDGPIVVQVGFQLLDINKVDDQSETFEFSGILKVRWKDARQAFDPAEEGVEEKFYQGNYQFNELAPAWYPEVVLLNVAGMFEKNGLVLRVSPDGTCTLVEGVNAVAKTKLKLRPYPFDHQHLNIVFAVLGYPEGKVVMEVLPMAEVNPVSISIPQWELQQVGSRITEVSEATVHREEGASVFVCEMELKRLSMFVIRLVVLPLFLVVVLSWSVFWMDRASIGDRMSVSFVGLLTVVAYQIVLGDILPHIAYLTLINGFVNFSFLFMGATIVVNLIVGELDRSGRAEEGNRLDLKCRRIFPLIYGLFLLLLACLAVFAD